MLINFVIFIVGKHFLEKCFPYLSQNLSAAPLRGAVREWKEFDKTLSNVFSKTYRLNLNTIEIIPITINIMATTK